MMRVNPSTCLPSQIPLAPSLETAYAVARAAEHNRSDHHAGYRLYYMATGRFGSLDVPLDGYAVVGRHSLCDAVLDADPAIALRHFLVRAARLDDGCPRLSVLDLHTDLGLTLDGNQSARSFTVSGPVAFYVGAYAIVGLPSGEPLPEVMPAQAGHPYRDGQVSRLTLFPRALTVGESVLGPTAYALTVQSSRGWASVRLSALDLELGVLVGRAPKCMDALRGVLDEGISRVHLLLRKDRVYDVASMRGTWVANGAGGWRRIRSLELHDGLRLGMGGAQLSLTKVDP